MTGAMDIELVLTPGLGNATWLVASDGDAAVIDPPRDAWRVLAAAETHGWRVTTVLETHVHNDYLSGALELRDATGSRIVAPARGRYAFDHHGADDGDEIALGGLRFIARATPGHTPEHLAWEVVEDGATVPVAVLTGGSLMVGSAGRTDLLGPAQTDALSAAQYGSLRALAALPDEVRVLPTHGAGSFCSAGPTDNARSSTIGAERLHNPLLRAPDVARFTAQLIDGFGPYPTYYAEMAPINRAGPPLLHRLPTPPALEPAAFAAAADGGARVIDARSRRRFAAGHLPGSLGIELGDSFASYVGWLVPFGAPIVLVLPDPSDEALAEATASLVRIGYDRIAGWLDGGVDRWADEGRPLESYPVVTARAVHEELVGGGGPQLLDVRDALELRDDGHIPGAIEIALDDLSGRLAEVSREVPVTVFCKSGARASIAASLLDGQGYDVRLVGVGGALEL